MKTYIFMLGRNQELSFLELLSYFKKEDIQHTLTATKDIALTPLPHFNYKKAILHLGGTLKIGEELEADYYTGTKNKITFAINYYKADPTKVSKALKAKFKALDLKATQKYVKTKAITPTKATNLDVEFIAYKDKLFKVVAASNPKAYKARDEKRPVFNPLKVTSIRLAKILINLAQPKKEILDPFCGTGTILQEALLMGYTCKGMDIATKDAQRNLRWLQQKYPAIKNKWELLQGDATRISKRIKSIECVVTEPYLGPYYKKPPTVREATAIANKLKLLYAKTLKALHPLLKNKLVIIIPTFTTKERKIITLPFATILKETGFKLYQPINKVKIPLAYTETKNNVQRAIYILEKA